MNPIGAAILTTACGILALYLLTTFQISMLARWFSGPHRPGGIRSRTGSPTGGQTRHDRAVERAREKAAERIARRQSQLKRKRGGLVPTTVGSPAPILSADEECAVG